MTGKRHFYIFQGTGNVLYFGLGSSYLGEYILKNLSNLIKINELDAHYFISILPQ